MPGTLDFERIHELQQGWYFPIRPPQEPMFGGDCGLIVNKQTGEVFRVPGSIFGVERDLDLYDKGYQFDAYDLVVLELTTTLYFRKCAHVLSPGAAGGGTVKDYFRFEALKHSGSA